MKKRITAAFATVVILVGVLSGCIANYEEIKLISECSDIWLNDAPQNSSDVYGYAVTDLDKDGRPEVLAAINGGKENVTACKVYKITADKKGLEECGYEGISDELMADLMTDKADCYLDKATGTYYYIFTDSITKSIRESYEIKVAVSLKDGVLKQEKLASKATIYQGESETPDVIFTGASGSEITENEFKNIAKIRFTDCERHSAEFGWKGYTKSNYNNISSLDQEKLLTLLADSYGKFKIS